MNNCSMCGASIPEGQSVCSMCYGDPDFGNDGYYQAELEREEREREEERFREQQEEELLREEEINE